MVGMHKEEDDSARLIQSVIVAKRARTKCVKKLDAYEKQQEALKKRQEEREEYVKMLMESNSPSTSPKSSRGRSPSKE